jgi:hypothetical protein
MATMSEGDSELQAGDTSLRAHVAPSYLIKTAAIAIVCLVLGVWGVWDYVEVIPTQERFFSRAEVCRSYRQIAEPVVSGGAQPAETEIAAFMSTVLDNLEIETSPELASEIIGLRAAVASGGPAAIDRLGVLLADRVLPDTLRQLASEHVPDGDTDTITTGPTSAATWFAAEKAMVVGVRNQTTISGDPSDQLRLGLQLSEAQLQLYGEIERPSAYDRPVQWLFILCLPFVPWYCWQLARNKGRVYVLHEDGSLELPGESWSPDEIADIDMSRWMRTSKAWIVHTDGHRVMLDDYVFKGTHRIVGAIASEWYPEQWTDEAKKVKTADASDS